MKTPSKALRGLAPESSAGCCHSQAKDQLPPSKPPVGVERTPAFTFSLRHHEQDISGSDNFSKVEVRASTIQTSQTGRQLRRRSTSFFSGGDGPVSEPSEPASCRQLGAAIRSTCMLYARDCMTRDRLQAAAGRKLLLSISFGLGLPRKRLCLRSALGPASWS
jgi:hypothetical protein